MDKGFNILRKLVAATNARQKVLASNLANVDTPGYKARDLRFRNLLGKEMKLLTTDRKHIARHDDTDGGKMVLEQNLSWADRNNVELNVEVAKMTENALLHDSAVKILSTKIKMFKNAIMSKGR